MGTNFASDKFNVKPDIMTMAKALTNGSMPMGAVCVRDEIYEAVTDNANENASNAREYAVIAIFTSIINIDQNEE